MAGFLLWLSITSIMIEVFKDASEQWLLFLHPKILAHSREHGLILICKSFSNIIWTMDMILFYNGRNSPESLQAYDPTLGGYIIQMEITSNMQIQYHCQHAPWPLGANAKSFFAHRIEDPTHHIIMSRPLGATNCSCQQFKVHKFYSIIVKGPLLSW